ncbi:unnamed protein product [Choristocarpus tenellus]
MTRSEANPRRGSRTRHMEQSDGLAGKNRSALSALPPESQTEETARVDSTSGKTYLIAAAGIKAMTEHMQDIERGRNLKQRIASWADRAGLDLPSVEPALGFLDVLGVSRATVYKSLMESALQTLLDMIPQLDKEVLVALLLDSFR